MRVRVGLEILGEDDLIGPGTADRKSVADYSPLRLAIEAKTFSQGVDETGGDHPAGRAVAANGFRGLQQVLSLGEVGVGIAVINESVEIIRCFPDAFPSAI